MVNHINMKRIIILILVSLLIMICFSISSCKKDVEIAPLKTEEISYNIIETDKLQCWSIINITDSFTQKINRYGSLISRYQIFTLQNLSSKNKIKYSIDWMQINGQVYYNKLDTVCLNEKNRIN